MVFDKGSLFGLQTAASLSSNDEDGGGGEAGVRERERDSIPPLVSLPARTLTLLDQGCTLTTSFNLNYFPNTSSPNTTTLRIRASKYEFGENVNIQFITGMLHFPRSGACFPWMGNPLGVQQG